MVPQEQQCGLALASQQKKEVRFARTLNKIIELQKERHAPFRRHTNAAQFKSSDTLEHGSHDVLNRAIVLREDAFDIMLKGGGIKTCFVTGIMQPISMQSHAFPNPSPPVLRQPSLSVKHVRNHAVNDYSLVNVFHGTSLSVLAPARNKTSHVQKIIAFDIKNRKFFLDSGASDHIVNCNDVAAEELESMHDATHPLKHRTANGVVTAAKVVAGWTFQKLNHYCICSEELTVFAIFGSACQVKCQVHMERF